MANVGLDDVTHNLGGKRTLRMTMNVSGSAQSLATGTLRIRLNNRKKGLEDFVLAYSNGSGTTGWFEQVDDANGIVDVVFQADPSEVPADGGVYDVAARYEDASGVPTRYGSAVWTFVRGAEGVWA